MTYLSTTGDLSPDARRTLGLVADGLGAGAIAERLGCDRDAVRRHLAEAIRGLDVRSVPAAVEIALRLGLVEPSAPRI